MSLRDHRLPLLLAGVITLLNTVKPAVVDDTAYLLFARHLAADPLQPYSFDLFWYYRPEPAMEILLPPVLPYWLAAGMALFGENLALLKLWMFPFAWVLCVAVRSLMQRFAPGVETEGTIAFSLSPAVLPLMSVMLDVPALALGAAAVALFVKGCDGRRAWAVLLASVCTALAVQTKYSMLTVPCVILGYSFTRLGKPRGWLTVAYAVAAITLAVGLFATWEWWLLEKFGHSHFLFHFKGNAGEGKNLGETLMGRFAFAPPLLGQFGGLACGVSLAASAGIGWPRRVRVAAAVGVVGNFVLICVLPYSATAPLGPRFDLAFLTFSMCGVSVVATGLFGLGRTLWQKTADADTLFLVGWVFVEAVGMLGMTPFPAARRVIGLCLATAVLLFHLVAKLGNGKPMMPRWGVAFAVGLGVLVWTVDCWDAQAEKVLATKAMETTKPAPGEVVWFTGHWGFQWYCERAGMQHLNPWSNGTPMKTGDWLVMPLIPNDGGFYRPCPMNDAEGRPFPRPDMQLEEVAVWEWRDALSGQTIPQMYGGGAGPLRGRDHPRLRVGVYRVMQDWWP